MAKKRRKPRSRRPASAAATAPATDAASKPASPPKPAAAPRRPRGPRRSIDEERPPAPWGSFPLVEIVVLIALVMLVAGLLVKGDRGKVMLVTGLALGSLAGLELSVREHFGGFRSHTALLAGAAGVATLALLFYAVPDLLPPLLRLVLALAVATAAAAWLARAFRARSGRMLKLR